MIDVVQTLNDAVAIACHLLAIIVISIGIVKALFIFFKDAVLRGSSAAAVMESRMELGHSFSLGLGFLIGASILRTTLAPTWNDIGQLAAIIGIRTVLNYFLLHEISRFAQPAATTENGKDAETAPAA